MSAYLENKQKNSGAQKTVKTRNSSCFSNLLIQTFPWQIWKWLILATNLVMIGCRLSKHKKISISASSWNQRGICVCIICCAGPVLFSAVVLMGFFPLIYWFIAFVCRRIYKQLDSLKSISTICLSTNYLCTKEKTKQSTLLALGS